MGLDIVCLDTSYACGRDRVTMQKTSVPYETSPGMARRAMWVDVDPSPKAWQWMGGSPQP